MIIKTRALDAEWRRHIKAAHGGDEFAPACFACEQCKVLDDRERELSDGVEDADERT